MAWSKPKKAAAGIGALFVAVALVSFALGRCVPIWWATGAVIDQCPDGDVVQTGWINAHSLRRGTIGWANFGVRGVYTTGTSDQAASFEVEDLSGQLFLVRPDGTEQRLDPEKDSTQTAFRIELPEGIPDGDYRLRARMKTSLGEVEQDLKVPLYAPARGHLITDRPLYEPGNTVQFRAMAVRAADLAPLDNRPGLFQVWSPAADVMLERKVPLAEWGVAAGSFPLDAEAPHGQWRVTWTSGDLQLTAPFTVEPFTLPRFTVDATPDRTWYTAGDRPEVRGTVRYSSGAPVAGADVRLSWTHSGTWPPPLDWFEGELPTELETGEGGTFEARLPIVPADLLGKAVLSASVQATDETGETVVGALQITLSEDPIAVEAVTELAAGLVEGFNNRLYLRVTRPDGQALRDTAISLRPAWDPNAEPISTETDADGVASVQLDPGAPVTVVVPSPPARPPPAPPRVARTQAQALVGNLSMGDRKALDGWDAPLSECLAYAKHGAHSVTVVVDVARSGTVRDVLSASGMLEECVARRLATQRLTSTGERRLLHLGWSVRTDHIADLRLHTQALVGDASGVEDAVVPSIPSVRSCLPASVPSLRLPERLLWKRTPGASALELSWEPDPAGARGRVPPSVLQCVKSRLRAVPFDEPSETEAAGTVSIDLVPGVDLRPRTREVPPTTMVGYELRVQAGDRDSTTLRMTPGQVPNLRVRAEPVIAKAGEPITFRILRGPNFQGQLPKTIWVQHEGDRTEVELDEKRVATFDVPKGSQGWFQVDVQGARALAYVPPTDHLAVSVEPSAEVYRPGDEASLLVRTTEGNTPVSAAVGLFGVDASMAQLAPLPGSGELDGLRPTATGTPPFVGLDAQALSMGRMRGENAAAATVLRVTQVPAPEQLDATFAGSAAATFDPLLPLADHFYGVLSELHAQVRRWEEEAPAGEQMSPPRMAEIFERAVDAIEAREEPVTDGFGRRMRLHHLPDDLLALTDPRAVVVEGTRLPEDVENWIAWVRKERP